MGGFSVTLSCGIHMRIPGSVIGSLCDLSLIVPVCGLGILKALALPGVRGENMSVGGKSHILQML